MSNKDKGKLATKYAEMTSKRSGFLERSQRYSKMTLPYVLPESLSTDEQNKQGFQGIGAEAVNHLANKIVATLFPVSEPFFKLGFDSDTEEELLAVKDKRTEIDTSLNKIVDLAIIEGQKMKIRPELINMAKNLIISGNGLKVFTDKGIKVLSLDKYVVKRDPCGTVLCIISKEKVTYVTLPEDLRVALRHRDSQKLGKKIKDDEEFDLYTCYELQEDGTYTITQDVGDVQTKVNISKIAPKDLPAIAGRWNSTSGEDYGRGLVEDHSGDLNVVEFLSEARARGAATMMDVKYLVRPGALTDVETLNKSRTGDFVSGVEDDISVLQLDKYADGKLISDVMDEYISRISRAFLMLNNNIRDSERTTAYEIRRTANELDLSLGGVYSVQVEDWQLPTANQLLKKVNSKLTDSEFTPIIKSGLASLGRADDLEKLVQFSELMALPAAWSEELTSSLDWEGFAKLVASSVSLDISFLFKKKDKKEEEDANRNANNVTSAMSESVAKSAGSVLGKKLIEGDTNV